MMFLFIICLGFVSVEAMDNGVARTPPMGWLAWERFRCVTDCKTYPDDCINEKLFKTMADRLAEDGWMEAGYTLVNIDDCWTSKKRDMNGNLVPDPERFPNGIKSLADYVHKKGLKLGIYGDYGTLTCGGYPGSMGYEKKDADTFASWGIDMLKFDGCYSNSSTRAEGYPLMSKMLNATGRPIIYECSWPAYEGGLPPKVNYTLLGEICNVWRNYGDIQDSWDDVLDITNWWGNHQDVLVPAAGPGKWNDPDMLLGGDFALSETETKSQFGIWAILAAPLFMSNDLRIIKPEIKDILQNKKVIRINQDKLGIQGKRIINGKDNIQVWMRPLTNNELAIGILSTRTDGFPHSFTMKLSDLQIESPAKAYSLDDTFSTEQPQVYSIDEQITVDVDPNGIRLYIAKPYTTQHFKQVLYETDFQLL